MIRLYVIEDHVFIVDGIKRNFSASRDGITVSGSAQSVDPVIQNTDNDSFDIILLDLWLDNKDPIQNFRSLKKAFPQKPIIIFTGDERILWIQRMHDEGAAAYISKKLSRSDLRTAIIKASQGERFFPVSFDILRKTEPQSGYIHILSPVQRKIIEMLLNGSSQKEVADVMGFSLSKIVKILNLLKKQFNAKNIPELFKILYDPDKISPNG